ncbi:Uncharacterized membrane protein YfcA [Fontimonas thermophila]|uniref:Probable membrane transporter protein n=1 Tax=Fontimonas thermophila TaxID=1076937 RepID=A0A1I2H360_9GAMM|nr:sulfite exporter TauE/SafE family protein [Fontimonas thermophila]SFF23121.1 Uncharacterized membrane protein YfcA [Fontimonas thermophila]
MSAIDAAIVLVAFLSATLSGVAGLGGGTILIGVLYAAGMAPAQAVPLFAAVQCVANSARTLAYLRHVEWHAAGWFSLAALPAMLLVAPFVEHADADLVRLVLSGLILASLLPTRAGVAALPPRPAFTLAGLLNGSLGMFVGATGLFVGRLFFRPEWRKETTIGTLALTQTLGHALRVVVYGFVGFSALAQPLLLALLCGAVIAGTALGKRLNGRLSEVQFAALFKWILIVLSIKLAYDGMRGLWWN